MNLIILFTESSTKQREVYSINAFDKARQGKKFEDDEFDMLICVIYEEKRRLIKG